MAKRSIITAARLREILHYVRRTGRFTWDQHTWQSRIGKPPGTVQRGKNGKPTCYVIQIEGTRYKAHILAWLYVTGEMPLSKLDHKNNNPLDNRWSNLRIATDEQNRWNTDSKRINNTSGLIGAFYDNGRWRAAIRHKFIGLFDTKEEAHEAYRKAAIELYGEFVHRSLKRNGSPRRTRSR